MNRQNDKIKALYMGWTDTSLQPLEPCWIPIYKITWDNKQNNFYASYTQGFEDNIDRLKGLIINPNCGYKRVWHLKGLEPLVLNRIPKRLDSMKLYDCLGIPEQKNNAIAYLSRSGGKRNLDDFDFFPEVAPDKSGYYSFYFLLEGLPQLATKKGKSFVDLVNSITSKDILEVEINTSNRKASIHYKKNLIGYFPKYISFLLQESSAINCFLKIERVNQDRRYLLKFLLKTTINFEHDPFKHPQLQPLNLMPIK